MSFTIILSPALIHFAGAIGAWTGGLIVITAVVSAYNLLSGLFYCSIVAKSLMTPLKPILIPLFSTLWIGIAAVTTGGWLLHWGKQNATEMWQEPIALTAYVGIYVVLAKIFMGNSFVEIKTLLLRATGARLI